MFKEKHLTQTVLLVLATGFLQACGGSSGTDGPTNTAPQYASISTLASQSSVTTDEDQPINYTPVTNNSPSISYTTTTAAEFGELAFENGQYTYTPNEHFFGSDKFVYTISDRGESVQHTVNITVEPVNDAPVLVLADWAFTIANSETFELTIEAEDVDGDALTFALITPPDEGELTLSEQGLINYQPTAGIETNTQFTFSISDGSAPPVEQEVTLNVLNPLQVVLAETAFSVETNEQVESSVTLTNVSQQPISYSVDLTYDQPLISTFSQTKSLIAAPDRSLSVAKGEKDPRTSANGTDNEGGPDAYDYRWIDSNHSEGPEYSWRDITSDGTLITGLVDDNVSTPINIGFDFPYYGSVYSSFYISSNGFISFTPTFHGCCTGQPLPSNDDINNIVAWMWADLHPQSGTVHVLSETDKVTVQFTDYGEYGGFGTVTSQVILHQDGSILLQYRSFTEQMQSKRASIGIENSDATGGLQVTFNEPYLEPELAVLFTQGEAAAWADIEQQAGTIEPESELALPLFVRGVNKIGSYTAQLVVTETKDGEEEDGQQHTSEITVDIGEDTTPPPAIDDLTFSSLSFASVNISWSAIADTGIDDSLLENYDIRISEVPITADTWSDALQYNNTIKSSDDGLTRTMEVINLAPETDYYLAVSAIDNNQNVSLMSNVLSITTLSPPEAALDNDEFDLVMDQGEVSEHTFTLSNNGVADLEYQIKLVPVVQDSTRAIANLAKLAKKERKSRTLTALPAKSSYIPDRLIVRFATGNAKKNTQALASTFNATTRKRIDKLNMEVWDLSPSTDMLETIQLLMARPDVLSAEPDYRLHTTSIPNDPEFTRLWGLHNVGQNGGENDADIDALEAWEYTSGSDAVVVAVIDTGIDYTHPDLIENMWVNEGEIPDNDIDDDGNGFVDDVYGYDFINRDGDPVDDNNHGTHVAGTIGAVGNNGIGITGVAQSVKLMALKFLGASGGGSTSDAIDSIIYAVDNGATILNNSWGGGGFDSNLLAAIEYANANGVLFVAAAGNGGYDNDLYASYPSGYEVDNVIAVAALDRSNNLAGFSQFGATTVDIGAPGVDIYSSIVNGGYDNFNGTSMATPHVAGVAALIQAYSILISMEELHSVLLDSAEPLAALEDKTVTGGSVNALNAILMAPPPWLTLDIESMLGQITAGESTTFTFTVNTERLSEEVEYEFIVQIQTNDPENPIISIPVKVAINPDTIAPSDIDDLTLVGNTDTTAEIRFTATGDDEQEGTASAYQIRFHVEQITDENWDEATQINQVPAPLPAGSTEQFSITGFEPDTEYFVALRAVDNFGLRSQVSNNIEFKTTRATLSYTPGSFAPLEVSAGEQTSLSVTISNDGDATLSVQLDTSSDIETVEQAPQTFFKSVEVLKGEEDPRFSRQVQDKTSGGPDNFGYRWIDSDNENGPEFEWVDISSTGTPVSGLGDDVVLGPFSIGFDFPFYDQVVDSFYISSNGFISFTRPQNSGCCAGQPLPSEDNFNNLIAWLWYDLFPGQIFYQVNDQGNLIIQFTDYGEYAGYGSVDAQIELSPSGSITLRYDNIRNSMRTNLASIGIENADSSDGLQVTFLEEYVKDQLAIKISAGWLRSEFSSITLAPGESQTVEIGVDATSLAPGNYQGTVRLRSNDPEQPLIELPVSLTVNP